MLSMLARRTRILRSAFARRRCERGNISLLFGMTLVPVIGLVGFGIDYGNAYRMRQTLQNSLDAAALAGGRVLELTDDDVKARQSVDDAFAANLGSKIPGATHTTTITRSTGMVVVTGNANVPTFLLPILQINAVPIAATAQIKTASKTFEIALVLDTSYSMVQPASKLASLKTAANNLTGILFDPNVATGRVKMAVVPFAGSVNVGTANAGVNANAAWMDTTFGATRIQSENFDEKNVSRQTLFANMRNPATNAKPYPWKGCVEVRRSPHDVTDSTPASGTPDSLFTPMFAPDEPDSPACAQYGGGGACYHNNYLPDSLGTPVCPNTLPNGATKQGRTCKYANAKPPAPDLINLSNIDIDAASFRGPDYLCDSTAITALTGNKSTITTAVANLVALGSTNIMEGLMWGWRALSPTEPFTQGRLFSDPNNTKIIVLMTDGDNHHYGLNALSPTDNKSIYHAFGFASKGRLRAATNNPSLLKAAMDSKTATACANAKLAGFVVYTVAFGTAVNATSLSMLNTCATDSAHAYTPTTESALIAAFEAIGRQISELRIAG